MSKQNVKQYYIVSDVSEAFICPLLFIQLVSKHKALILGQLPLLYTFNDIELLTVVSSLFLFRSVQFKIVSGDLKLTTKQSQSRTSANETFQPAENNLTAISEKISFPRLSHLSQKLIKMFHVLCQACSFVICRVKLRSYDFVSREIQVHTPQMIINCKTGFRTIKSHTKSISFYLWSFVFLWHLSHSPWYHLTFHLLHLSLVDQALHKSNLEINK